MFRSAMLSGYVPALAVLTVAVIFAGCSPPAPPATAVVVEEPDKIQEATPVEAATGDWPWWRGAGTDNLAEGSSQAPTKWTANENVVWKASIPGRGHATPIVVGDRVIVATADEKAEKMLLLSYDRKTGQEQWNTLLHEGSFPTKHPKNSFASSTPACDGEHIFAVSQFDGAIRVSKVSLDGKIVWQKSAGEFTSKFGYGSSPVIYKSLVIIQGDNTAGGFLTALYRDSGELAWRAPRKSSDSYGTPLISEAGGETQLLLHGQLQVVSYNPDTGEELWRQDGTANTAGNTMASDGEILFASGGYPQRNLIAMNAADGKILWSKDYKVYIPSLLAYDGRLLAVQDDGIARLFDAKSGQEIWKKRLGGGYSASPVKAGDAIYAHAEDGTVHVFRASGDKYESLATNKIADTGFASPVFAGGRLYLRTGEMLYCIGK